MTKIYNRTSEKEKRRQLRKNMPPAEVLLWSRLRGRQALGLKFRRQYSVGPYVLDFYCPALKLAVEIDGDTHAHEAVEVYDRERQAFIESFGVRFLRFTNEQVYDNLESVVEFIVHMAEQLSEKTTSD